MTAQHGDSHARFWQKYLRLTRSGVLALRALEIIAEEERAVEFAEIIKAVRSAMHDGASMSEALAAFPNEFSLSERELIKVAEKRGAWDEVLQELADGLRDGTFN